MAEFKQRLREILSSTIEKPPINLEENFNQSLIDTKRKMKKDNSTLIIQSRYKKTLSKPENKIIEPTNRSRSVNNININNKENENKVNIINYNNKNYSTFNNYNNNSHNKDLKVNKFSCRNYTPNNRNFNYESNINSNNININSSNKNNFLSLLESLNKINDKKKKKTDDYNEDNKENEINIHKHNHNNHNRNNRNYNFDYSNKETDYIYSYNSNISLEKQKIKNNSCEKTFISLKNSNINNITNYNNCNSFRNNNNISIFKHLRSRTASNLKHSNIRPTNTFLTNNKRTISNTNRILEMIDNNYKNIISINLNKFSKKNKEENKNNYEHVNYLLKKNMELIESKYVVYTLKNLYVKNNINDKSIRNIKNIQLNSQNEEYSSFCNNTTVSTKNLNGNLFNAGYKKKFKKKLNLNEQKNSFLFSNRNNSNYTKPKRGSNTKIYGENKGIKNYKINSLF